jgi:hypothetical protein
MAARIANNLGGDMDGDAVGSSRRDDSRPRVERIGCGTGAQNTVSYSFSLSS